MSLRQEFRSTGASEGPLSLAPRAQEINSDTKNDDHDSVANLSRCVGSLRQHEYESDNCDQRRNWIEPHAKWSRKLWPATPKPEQTKRLDEELDHDADHYQCRNHVGQSQEAEKRRYPAEHEQRH